MQIDLKDLPRVKATILFYALERGLARLVRQNLFEATQIPESMAVALRGRAVAKREVAQPSVEALISEMYFQELVEVLGALKSVGDEIRQAARDLLGLAEKFGLHEVRVAVAHQNRPWKANYLSIVESVCLSETVTAGLELQEVGEAYAQTQLNLLELPPKDWLQRIRSMGLPHNMDEHTRAMRNALFVGRLDERKKLQKHLMHPRTNAVCVVGPGGVGKTAFALKVLTDLAHDSSASARFDRIVFVTGKQRSLTANGVIQQTPDFHSLEELRLAIALELGTDSFDECVEALAELRLLLCVDNIEELVGAHPQCLEDLQENLPTPWVLLTTSRVPVPAQYSIPLGQLKIHELQLIAQERLRSAGIEPEAVQQMAQLLAAGAPSPLALTVATDLVCFGGLSAAQALARSNHWTADFAFSSLLDLLPQLSLEVLDAIRATCEEAGLDAIAQLLNCSRGDLDVSIVELRRANMLLQVNAEGDDVPKLQPAVRDLLSQRAVSSLNRAEVFGAWCRIRNEVQTFHDATEFGLPTNEQIPLARRHLLKIREKIGRSLEIVGEDFVAIHGEISSFEERFGASANSRWLMADLTERSSFVRHEVSGHLFQALKLAPDSWVVAARLSRLVLSEKDYISCANLLKPFLLLDGTEKPPIPDRIYSEIFSRYFRARTFLESDRQARGGVVDAASFQSILDEIENITGAAERHNAELARLLAKVVVLRRSVERVRVARERLPTLLAALQIVSKTFEQRGSSVNWWAREVSALLHEFQYLSRAPDAENLISAIEEATVAFTERWGREVFKYAPTLAFPVVQRGVLAAENARVALEAPPSARPEPASDEAQHEVSSDFAELARYGFLLCEVYAPPYERKYCFARDQSGQNFFVHRSMVNCSDQSFAALTRGASIAILPDDLVLGAGTRRALSGVLL